jgi:uncharacterized protein YjbI with pentapeptide repeats
MRALSTRVCLLALVGAVALTVGGAVAATPENAERLRATGSCPGCDLISAELQGLKAVNGDLTGANLLEANLYTADLSGANLTGANFDGANLRWANLTGATGAVLSNAVTDERTTCPSGNAGPCE